MTIGNKNTKMFIVKITIRGLFTYFSNRLLTSRKRIMAFRDITEPLSQFIQAREKKLESEIRKQFQNRPHLASAADAIVELAREEYSTAKSEALKLSVPTGYHSVYGCEYYQLKREV